MLERNEVTVLIADDDPAIVRLMASTLTQHGFRPPREVGTGHAALAAADQADILLLDYRLPDLSGTEVLERLQHHPKRPAVILVTGHGGEEVAAGALRLGAEDYLNKGASLPELLPEVVDRVRRRRALRATLAEAERELLIAARREAIGEMKIMLHHEINNPLMAAFAEVSLLLDDARLGSVHRTGVKDIQGALERIHDIMRRVSELDAATAVDYLPGVPMMDLDAPPEPTPEHGSALLFLENPSLARVTESLLGRAGYAVERCSSVADLQSKTRAEDVALVVVASAGDGDPLGGYRPAGERTHGLVVIAPDDGAAAREAGADWVFPLPFDPSTFVRLLRDGSTRG